MTDQLPSSLLDLWRDVDAGFLPIDDLLRQGRRVRARRRRIVLAVAATVIPVAIGTGVVVQQLSRDQAPPATDMTHGPTRQVGFGAVVVSVPDEWVTRQPVCQTPTEPYVFFTSTAIYNCPNLQTDPTDSPQVPSIQFGSLVDSNADTTTLRHQSDQFGLIIKHSDLECRDWLCQELFAADGVAIIIRAPQTEADELIQSIGESIRPIAEGHAAVPFIEPGTPVREGRKALLSAGFEVTTTRGASTSLVLAMHPDAGTILEEGTTVTLEISLD